MLLILIKLFFDIRRCTGHITYICNAVFLWFSEERRGYGTLYFINCDWITYTSNETRYHFVRPYLNNDKHLNTSLEIGSQTKDSSLSICNSLLLVLNAKYLSQRMTQSKRTVLVPLHFCHLYGKSHSETYVLDFLVLRTNYPLAHFIEFFTHNLPSLSPYNEIGLNWCFTTAYLVESHHTVHFMVYF